MNISFMVYNINAYTKIYGDPDYQRSYVQNEVEIRWVSDPLKVGVELAERTEQSINSDGDSNGSTFGTAYLSIRDTRKCTIYAYEPKNENDLKYIIILGHETLHCFRGEFHKE